MQNFEYGEYLDIEKLFKLLHDNEDWFDNISILGGDLLCQSDIEAEQFSIKLRAEFPNKKLYLFTGANLSEISDHSWVYCVYDVIKYGKYDETLRNESNPSGLATTNQKYIKKGVDY